MPHMVLGDPFNPAEGQYSTSSWMAELFVGKRDGIIASFFTARPPTWIVDVSDTAVLHVAALLAVDISGRRLWAAGHQVDSVNDLLDIWRQTYPDREITADFAVRRGSKQDLDRSVETELLHRYAGRDYVPLRQTLIETVRREVS
jgi:hypothetical protein